MAQTDAEVLKEFLVALGFRVDERGFKGFVDILGLSEKLVGSLAIAAFTAGTAVTAFAAKMATSHEKLAYFSQLTGDSASNLNAFSFAASKVGVAVEAANSTLESFALKLQTDPGQSSLLAAIGIDPRQDPTKVLVDYIKTPMSKVMRSTYDQLLGLNDEVIFQLVASADKLGGYEADYNKRLKDAGVNLDALNKGSIEIKNSWRDIENNIDLAANVIYSAFLPRLEDAAREADELSRKFLDWLSGKDRRDQAVAAIGGVAGIAAYEAVTGDTVPDGRMAPDQIVDLVIKRGEQGKPGQVSSKGALGTMQVMPDTAKEVAQHLGIPYDEQKLRTDDAYNRKIGSAYLRELLTKYGGDTTLALAAYNAGPGAVDYWIRSRGDPRNGRISYDDWVKGIPVDETRRYLERTLDYKGTPEDEAYNRKFFGKPATPTASQPTPAAPLLPTTDTPVGYLGVSDSANHALASASNVTINQDLKITVTGNGDANEIADAVSSTVQRTNGDLVRNMANTPR